MSQLSGGQRKMILAVIVLVDVIATGILVMAVLGWTDVPIVVPVLLLVASSGLLVAFTALGRRRDTE